MSHESTRFSCMNVPDTLRYSSDHEWALLLDDGSIKIGITDYAQDALGDVVFVELPDVGADLDAGATFGEVESTKSVSDLFAPLAGTVATVNDQLTDSPEKINEDPYGDGWICTLTPADASSYESLLDSAAYVQLIEG